MLDEHPPFMLDKSRKVLFHQLETEKKIDKNSDYFQKMSRGAENLKFFMPAKRFVSRKVEGALIKRN